MMDADSAAGSTEWFAARGHEMGRPQRLEMQPQPTSSGAEGIRTLDPLVANQVLSQLSYRPDQATR